MDKKSKKINIHDSENTVVRVSVAPKDGNVYECAGVLMKDSDKEIRIGFNAINDVVRDYLDIEKEYILNIVEVPLTEIVSLR